MSRWVVLTGFAAASILSGCASGPFAGWGCPSEGDVADMARRYRALQMLPNPPASLSVENAACGADKFVRELSSSHGPVVGYKAGLTNPAIQQRFGVSAPIRGVLLQKMVLGDGATLPARFGARPFVEPDLIVEVASPAIHDAKTHGEVLAALRSLRPFIELPDTLVEDPAKINAATLTLINVGARLGVVGAPIPVRNDAAFITALRDMRVRAVDQTGKELAAGNGASVMGNPLNAVMWLVADLKKAGITLKPGDLLSLGAFGTTPAEAGKTVRVHYDGLPGNPSVSVNFR